MDTTAQRSLSFQNCLEGLKPQHRVVCPKGGLTLAFPQLPSHQSGSFLKASSAFHLALYLFVFLTPKTPRILGEGPYQIHFVTPTAPRTPSSTQYTVKKTSDRDESSTARKRENGSSGGGRRPTLHPAAGDLREEQPPLPSRPDARGQQARSAYALRSGVSKTGRWAVHRGPARPWLPGEHSPPERNGAAAKARGGATCGRDPMSGTGRPEAQWRRRAGTLEAGPAHPTFPEDPDSASRPR
ncbi:hypothetical protein J1605_016529 [Eschrichtius robustus]|uniref:Uncharacterized protein n=1 Tax=Eschrichtius robustus TaxID=9764 RepID=A0AB34I6S2_ESCRO|nr:hypothetical protein J1605_016529 [Eschrichtius robustus]